MDKKEIISDKLKQSIIVKEIRKLRRYRVPPRKGLIVGPLPDGALPIYDWSVSIKNWKEDIQRIIGDNVD